MDKYKTELVKQCCCVGGLNCRHCKPLKKDKSNKIARTRLKAGDKKNYEKLKSKTDM